MTRRDKEEMLELIIEELLPLLKTLDIPAAKAGLSEEWEAAFLEVNGLKEALEDIL